mmetsp:Transcript_14677/g.27202  ORF Transcript_14677/g.27202 Transcript_14677/m.27202 type:complete len:109 (+) Transcript_14677:1222-1548(+)
MGFKYRNPKLKISRRYKARMKFISYPKYEYYLKILKYIITNKTISKQTRVLCIYHLTMFPSYVSKTQHKNTCLITGQHRGVNLQFKMHRGTLRQQAANLLIPGLSPAS